MRFVFEVRDQIVGIKNGSQIEQEAILSDPSEDRRPCAAKFLGDLLGPKGPVADRDHLTRNLLGRERAAADLRRGIFQAQLKPLAERLLELRKSPPSDLLDLLKGTGEGL